MANTADLIRSGSQQAAAGAAVDSDSISGTPTSLSNANPDSNTEIRAEESTQEDLFPADPSEDTPPDSETEGSAKPEAKSQTSGKEVITVTDETGRKRRVEIDYADREAIKKAYSMMHGARKWQAERDQAIAARKADSEKYTEVQSNWNTLESAYQKGGIEGLVDLLEGRRGAYKEHVQKQVQRAKFLENASPEEVEALEARERADATARELDRIRKENDEFRKQMTQERETAELRSLESQVNPVFDKYRFADKLGNPDDEHMFDEMLWTSALKRLEAYEEKGLSLNSELIDREFRTVAASIRNRIGGLAEKKAGKAIAQKKQEATENVQTKVKSGYKTEGAAAEARSLIDSGNLTGLLKGWGKYGGLFNGKK